jgi:hypothetical protein
MNLFINIQITNHPNEVKFNIPVMDYVKEQNLNIIIYDIDNHSDSLITNYATQLIQDSEQSLIYIEAQPDIDFNNLFPLITNILDNPEGKQIIIKGSNHKLEKMMRIFPYAAMTENTSISEAIQPIIEQFFAKKEHL